jgi:hypothetical protein
MIFEYDMVEYKTPKDWYYYDARPLLMIRLRPGRPSRFILSV